MADHLTPSGRSRVMASIRSKDTKPELLLRAQLRARGIVGYRLHAKLPGRPDVAFTRWRLAVFIDGAFWHGHPDHFRPDTATDYWRTKIARTQERDRAADASLRADGWTVLRFWDFDMLSRPGEVLDQVESALAALGRPHRQGDDHGRDR